MSIVVVGCGRSGTNMALEILSGSAELKSSHPPEDKGVFGRKKVYPKDYLTKCDTIYFNNQQMNEALLLNPKMRIVWTIRDPRDMAMSKLRRGASRKDGGDCGQIADDGTEPGCIADIRRMAEMYRLAMIEAPSRIHLIHMEDMIMNTEMIAKQLAIIAEVKYVPAMMKFWERMRVPQKRERYKGIDVGQLSMWKKWKEAYEGWLCDKFDMDRIFDVLRPITERFGYGACA